MRPETGGGKGQVRTRYSLDAHKQSSRIKIGTDQSALLRLQKNASLSFCSMIIQRMENFQTNLQALAVFLQLQTFLSTKCIF